MRAGSWRPCRRPYPRADANRGRKLEHLCAAYVTAALDLYRDLRDAGQEAAFYEVYGNLWSLQMADQRAAGLG